MHARDISRKGRQLLAYAVEKRYGISERPLVLMKREKGKPYLMRYPEIEFNISHSGDYVVVALSEYPVGIDIQEMRITQIDKLGKHVFADAEYRDFLLSPDRQEAFFRTWVRKEAYVKRTGEGLSRPLKDLPMDGWFQYIEIDRGYFCAICAELPLTVEVEEVTNL